MAKAKIVDELVVVTPNEVGTLGEITDGLVSAGIGIIHLCAYVKGGQGHFMVITSDNERAASLMKEMGYEINKTQTIEIEFENKPGTLAPIAKRLGDNGIDIEYIFGTSADGGKVLGIMTTSDNQMALELING